MKIRLHRSTYAAAQRIADAEGQTFSAWAMEAIRRWVGTHAKPDNPKTLTRSDSVSASVSMNMTTIPANRIRECIEYAVEHEEAKPWPWRYDRATLKAVQTIEHFWSRTCSFADAKRIMDKRLAERTAELRVEQQAKRAKRHTGGHGE